MFLGNPVLLNRGIPLGHQMIVNNVRQYRCVHWGEFGERLKTINAFNGPSGGHLTIYRGHRDPDWALDTFWERKFCHRQRAGLFEPYSPQPDVNSDKYKNTMQTHLEKFKGLAMQNGGAQDLLSYNDDQWWALGRHYSLWTPFLDWTLNPLVAAYFAFDRKSPSEAESVTVWALNVNCDVANLLDFAIVRTTHACSKRQQAQSGLFTRLTSAVFADIKEYLHNEHHEHFLARVDIPFSEAHLALNDLYSKGITATTLFPDSVPASSQLEQAAVIANECLNTLPSNFLHKHL